MGREGGGEKEEKVRRERERKERFFWGPKTSGQREEGRKGGYAVKGQCALFFPLSLSLSLSLSVSLSLSPPCETMVSLLSSSFSSPCVVASVSDD